MQKILLSFILIVFTLSGYSQNSTHQTCMHTKIQAFKNKQKFVPHGLSENYDLIYQRPFWIINPAQHYIKGNVTSYFTAKENNVATLYFDLKDNMLVDSVLQRGERISFNHQNNLIEITLPTALSVNQTDSLTIYYKGAPSSDGFGSFETSNHNGTPVLWTLSEPYGARDWWPCKQTLTDKIDSIDIFVQTDPEYRVGSNGKLISETISDNIKITHWKHRHSITTYLVAIAATNYSQFSDFARVSETDSVEILNYVYPENFISAENQAAYTVDVMELYSEKFMPYPFWDEKYGHAQFGWGGGMEHQTMSFMGGFSPGLIAHELAHQWFGDFITCGSWADIWVNEGFAVFCENITTENLHPDTWLYWKSSELNYVLNYGKTGSVYVDDTTNVNRIFNGVLTYSKGGYLLHMLRFQIGDSAFFAGLQNMLHHASTANAFANGVDVQAFLEEAADTSLSEFFNDWYFGQGYPIYNINWMQNDDNKITFTVNQTQTHSSVDFFEMNIPILLVGENDSLTVHLHNLYNGQNFTRNPGFKVTNIAFDPDLNILCSHQDVLNHTSINHLKKQPLRVYPNPASGVLYFQTPKNRSILQLIIVDTQGKQIIKYNALPGNYLSTQTLENGIYFLKVTTNDGLFTQKFVKTN